MAISYGKQITFSAFLLQDIIDPSDELVRLAHIVDWERVHDRLRPYYSTIGRQALPIRLMVGLHLLKHKEGLSDAQTRAKKCYRISSELSETELSAILGKQNAGRTTQTADRDSKGCDPPSQGTISRQT